MYKHAPQSKDWVGRTVAYALGPDFDDESEKKRVVLATKTLIKEVFLVKLEDCDLVQWKMVTFMKCV